MIILPYARQAQFYETDQMGIIHHANYIHWFEEARVDLLRQLGFGYDVVEREGYSFAVLGISCDYRAMTRFYDTLEIYCGITLPRGSTFNCNYRVLDTANGELRATGESRHAVLTHAGRPVALKKALPGLYEVFMELMAE